MSGEKSNSTSVWSRLTPVLLLSTVALAFFVGMLWQKVSLLEGNGALDLFGNKQAAEQLDGSDTDQLPTNGKLSSSQAEKLPAVTSDDHILGDLDQAEVLLVEYSDFECPFCERFHSTAQQVYDEYEGRVAWVYRHFPLDSLHPKARPAAEASECVASIGGNDAFWAFTNAAFEGGPANLSDLAAYAETAGVDAAEFKTCVDENKFADVVTEQYTGGSAAGVTGTPGNFILNKDGDTWLIPGAVPFESLQATIDEALGS